jgi:hypothetical protein
VRQRGSLVRPLMEHGCFVCAACNRAMKRTSAMVDFKDSAGRLPLYRLSIGSFDSPWDRGINPGAAYDDNPRNLAGRC